MSNPAANPFDPIPTDGLPIELRVTCANWWSVTQVSAEMLRDKAAHPMLLYITLRTMRQSFGESTPQGSEENWRFTKIALSHNVQRLLHVYSAELVPKIT